MESNWKSWVIAGVIVLILLVPIFVDYNKSGNVEVVSFKDYTSMVNDGNFHVVYFGDVENSSFDTVKENLSTVAENYEVDAKAVEITSLSETELASLFETNSSFSSSASYAIIKDGEVLYVTDDELSSDKLDTLINKYYNNVIPKDDIAYKTVSTYKEYKKVIDSKNIVMTVFGRSNCSWCVKFQPIYNDVAAENNLDIYFIDSNSFDANEYEKIMNSGLTIPAECNDSGKDQVLSDGFGTPLTLFTKNGKVIGCIGGYMNKTSLVAKLKDVGMIK